MQSSFMQFVYDTMTCMTMQPRFFSLLWAIWGASAVAPSQIKKSPAFGHHMPFCLKSTVSFCLPLSYSLQSHLASCRFTGFACTLNTKTFRVLLNSWLHLSRILNLEGRMTKYCPADMKDSGCYDEDYEQSWKTLEPYSMEPRREREASVPIAR